MEYFLLVVNILLIIIIMYNIYNWLNVKEGLEGCPASQSEQEGDRSRRASRQEIDATIKDLKAQINGIRNTHITFLQAVSKNENKLKEVSKAATDKAKRNKAKLDKVNS